MIEAFEKAESIKELFEMARKMEADEQECNAVLSLDEMVELSLSLWPMLMHSKGDVLHEMFFVLGNGFSWFQGRLSYNRFNSKIRREMLVKAYQIAEEVVQKGEPVRDDEFLICESSEKTLEFYHKLGEWREASELLKARDGLKERSGDNELRKSKKSFYNCTDRCAYMKVPDNVESDYLTGAISAGEKYLEVEFDQAVSLQLTMLKKMFFERATRGSFGL